MSKASTSLAGQRGVSSGNRFPLQATAVACSLYLLSLGLAQAQQAEGGSLSEVVVSASGVEQKIADAPASISVVTREELAKRPYTTLLDAVRDIEGVDVGETTDKTGQGTISIRGMGGDYTLILVDGKRQNNNGDLYPNSFGGNQFNHIPPIEAIERIEVIRGPMSTLYGADALGGVINIITRKIPDRWTGSVTQSFTHQENKDFGNDRTTDFNLMGPIKPGLLGMQIRGSIYNREASKPNYGDIVYPNGEVRPRVLGFGGGGKTVDNENQSLGLRLALTPNSRHEFIFDIDASRQEYNNRPEADGSFPLGTVDSISTIWRASGGVVAPQVGYLPEQKFTRDQWSLTHKGKWDIGNSEVSLSYVDTANKGRTLPFSPEERARLQALWNAVPGATAAAKLAAMTPAQRATLEAFLPRPARVMETRQYTLDAKLDMPLGDHLIVVGGQFIDGEMEDGTFGMFGNNPRPGTVQEHKMKSVFAEGNWQLRQNVTLTTGVRHDNHNIFGGQTSPRVYGVWEASPSWTFKGGVSTGYKTPKTSQLFPGITGFGGQGTSPFVGNPDLQPETSVNGELAAYFNSPNGHSFNATVFQNRFKDKIDSGGPRVQNCEVAGSNPATCADVGTGWLALGFADFAQTQNISRAEINGFELAGRYRISPTWMLRANYTYTDSEQKSGAAIGRPLSESAKHMANTTLSWAATPALEMFLTMEAASDRYRGWDTATNSALFYKSYNIFHLGGSFRLSKNVTINARINNLLDHDFTTYRTTFAACTTGTTCVGGQAPTFVDDYNVKAKSRNFWISLNARF
ncbi:TonB-dependent receptor domain-containing protein [Hydrogenophaga laconesensis]|uniref:Outer membrane receptor for ferrienterochelin and colicins n=1 Tax=Hydrogenophaga laconesensis TaxID=1805971 RepID=A0ABU1VAG6_9BURK|nr:TonB-dependent receptor [Hydrogenophaga laconesensis]MDR7094213.1 outer membrane receptor for ferrienterochelin and colicins [Hydrogenophaga laconesensis]